MRSFSQIIDSFFKKEKKDTMPEELEVINNQAKEENLIKIIRPNRIIDHQTYQKIEKFLETHSA
jgi:predicted CopG family antitoxin